MGVYRGVVPAPVLVPGVVVVAPFGDDEGPAGIGVTGGVVIGVTGVTPPGFAVPGVALVPVPGVAVPVVPVAPGVEVPVAPGVVVSGWLAPFEGGIVEAPGPVPGAHGAITSAFGAPFEPIVPAVPVEPTMPGVDVPGGVSAPGVVVVLGVALPPAVPFVAFGGTTPLVPVGPASGTHGIVAGGGVTGAATPDGDDGDVVEGVCAIAGAESPNAMTAAYAMKVEVLCMTPPYSRGGVCTARARYLDDTV